MPFILFLVLVIAGFSNAVNLTDGLDGLAIGCVLVSAAALTVLTYVSSNARFADYLEIQKNSRRGRADHFLRRRWWARRSDFFGTTRIRRKCSWAMSARWRWAARSASIAVIIKQEILLFSIGGVFVLEALSVILQVGSFKLTGQAHFSHGAAASSF